MQNEKPLLTISLLISNRPDTIRRCLDSLRLIMEAVPCELILTDTSKNPEINAICHEYTDQVFEFEWCHDFAKARNVGLQSARGEWFIFLDDDEWFVDSQKLIDFFTSGEYQKYERATYLVRNFYDPEYVQYADCWVSRMNRIGNESRFVGTVHEYMEPCTGPEKHIHAMAYHSGYVFYTEEERTKHAQRNIVLLLEALKEEPNNIRWQTQLAQEYRSSMNWEQLVAYCRECIGVTGVDRNADVITTLQRGTFYAGLVEGLIHLGQYQESIVCGEEILEDIQANPLLKVLAYICLAEAYFEVGDWDKASEYADVYLKEEQRLNSTDILSYEQKLVSIVQHAFDPANIKKAYSILICRDLQYGSTRVLHEYYDKLEWNETENFVFEKLPSYLIEVMPNMVYQPIFSQIITDTFKRDDFKVFMCREALKLEEENPEAFAKLAYIYAQVQDDFWFIWYMKLADAVSRQEAGLLASMSKEEWEISIRSFISQATEDQIHRARTRLQTLQQVMSFDDWKCLCFENIILEKQVMDGPRDLGNLEVYYSVLKRYAQMENLLQSTAQATKEIRGYIEVEAQDTLQAIKHLKAAVDACPDFAEGISRFIGVYADLEKQRARKQHEEMSKLRNQVVQQVKGMLANGQNAEAMAIVQQLKQMFPEDLEVAALALEIRISL